MAFRIIRNDITKVKADAIVNTANPRVAVGNGVDSAIYEAAGKAKLLFARKKIGNLNVGEVGITRAFHLEAKYIIHSCGPCWIDGLHQEQEILRQCYDKCLDVAYKHHCKSIAFPLMSTGTYGFPKELGLQIALEAFSVFLLQHDIEIILAVFEETAFKISGKIFEDVRQFVDNSYVEHKLREEYRHDGICGQREERRMLSSPMIRWEKSGDLPTMYEESQSDFSMMPHEKVKDSFMMSKEKPSCSPMVRQESQNCAPSFSKIPSKLDLYIQQEAGSFGEYMQQLINKKGMKNSEVYAAANLTKQYFSKLLKGKVTPSKTKILSLAVALHLNMDETVDFLRMSGYAFSPFSPVDKIFEYFIQNKIYDIYKIDIVLFDYGLPTLVND